MLKVRHRHASLLALLMASSLVASVHASTPPALTQAVMLKAHGGATLQVPSWKSARSDESVAVLERTGVASRGGFTTLILAVEEGPQKTEVIDWEAVKGNIVDAAKSAGSNLSLSLKGDWEGAAGFRGQRFRGAMRSGERDVSVEMIALIASGVMVTITALGPAGDGSLAGLADAVAKTTARPTGTP